jgi:hypothetical protein
VYNVFQVRRPVVAHARAPRRLPRRPSTPVRLARVRRRARACRQRAPRRAVRVRSQLPVPVAERSGRVSTSRRAAARAPQVKTDDEDVTAEDMQGHVLSILAGGAGAHLGDKRRRAAAARA